MGRAARAAMERRFGDWRSVVAEHLLPVWAEAARAASGAAASAAASAAVGAAAAAERR
jgi:hypothetical protein